MLTFQTLEKAIDLYYYSYGNGKEEFEHLSLEKFRDIVHTFVNDYGQKSTCNEKDEELKNSTILYMQGMLEGAAECENIDDIKEFNKIISWLKSLKPTIDEAKELVEDFIKQFKNYIQDESEK